MAVSEFLFALDGNFSLVAGQTYTSLTTAPTPNAIPANTGLVIGFGQGSTTQVVITSADVTVGATTIPVNSFVANANYTGSDVQTEGMRSVLWKTLSTVAVASGGNTGSLPLPDVDHINCGLTVISATGTSPSITFFIETLGADQKWYTLWSSGTITTLISTGTSIGDGMATAQMPTNELRVRWTVAGTGNPTVTFSGFMEGK